MNMTLRITEDSLHIQQTVINQPIDQWRFRPRK